MSSEIEDADAPSDAVQREGDLKGVIATGLVVVWHDHDICYCTSGRSSRQFFAPPLLHVAGTPISQR